eukprot:m.6158 g.6158  ORF g.6158 m.6158 type:complete len:635 (+) comp3490_c0_seq1:62-1966(+)
MLWTYFAALLPLLACVHADGGIKVNTTTVTSGSAVMVSWSDVFASRFPEVDLKNIPEMKTVWLPESSESGAPKPKVIIVPDNASSYWVGQFSPAITNKSQIFMGPDPTKKMNTEGTPPFTVPAPVKFISGSQLNNGYHEFIVTNMRTTVNFVLFEGSLSDPNNFQVVAMSDPITFSDATKPMHGRLARTTSTSEMRVSWTSAQSDTQATHIVEYGTSANSLTQQEKALTYTYSAANLCGPPANYSGYHDPGFMHTAVLDLSTFTSGQSVYYKFGSTQFGFSEIFSFKTPQPVAPNTPLSIAVFADMGETYEDGSQYHWEEPAAVNTSFHVQNRMKDPRGIDLILHPGDLSYATGYESEWDRFMEQIEPLSTQVPYMTGQGNHERDFPLSGNFIGSGDSGGECGVPTQARFYMPCCAQPNTGPCIGQRARTLQESPISRMTEEGPTGSQNDGWYSFEQGPVHIVMMNTEMNSSVGTKQYDFLKQDLASVNRSATPWVFLSGHRQLISGNDANPANDLNDVEDLLMTYKVDLAFWGHIHFAQATCPMYKGKCVTEKDAGGYDAPIHTVIGNAGQGLTKVDYKLAPFNLYNVGEWGYSMVTIYNSTLVQMDFYADAPLDAASPIHHTFTIERKYPRV